MVERRLIEALSRVVEQYGKMAFVSGARQVGKTTLARAYRDRVGQGAYLSWDIITDQKRLLRDPYFYEQEDRDPKRPYVVVLDEIHKYARWKNYLKGAYDRSGREFGFVVTGSGRLDLYKKGGDSLVGRYLALPLFPLTVGEVAGKPLGFSAFLDGADDPPASSAAVREVYERLLRFSGFPDPFVRGEDAFYSMWAQERKTLLVRDDIRGATAIREISLVEHLSHLLPGRVGAPLSVNALREDVGVAFETARDWIAVLERFYYLFRVAPYTGSLRRTLRKETKAYLYDWGEVEGEGPRFENVVALHLKKAVDTWAALGDGKPGLAYVRDKEKREVDFVVTDRGKPVCLVECKISDETPSPDLLYFQARLEVPIAFQVVHRPGVSRRRRDGDRVLRIISADRFLQMLP